jgi:hypothetical protein
LKSIPIEKSREGGSGAMWNMGQNETSLYFCMKQVLKLLSCLILEIRDFGRIRE